MHLPYDPRGDGDEDSGIGPRFAKVTDQATHLWPAQSSGPVLLVNRDLTDTVYIGGPDVSTSSLPLPPLGTIAVPGDRDWHGVTDNGKVAGVWAVPGATAYTSSPAEQAAQLALTGITIAGGNMDVAVTNSPSVDVLGTVTVDASGHTVVVDASGHPVALTAGTQVDLAPGASVGVASGPAGVAATGAIGALNAAATVSVRGLNGVGFSAPAGTLTGTLVPEISMDGGTTWQRTTCVDPNLGGTLANSVQTVNPSPAFVRTMMTPPGTTHARVRCSAYTSGTLTITVSATTSNGLPSTVGITGTPNVAVPGGIGVTSTAGAAAGTPPTGVPAFAIRNVSAQNAATGTVSSSASTPSGTATIIANPGAGQKVELHTLTMKVATSVSGTAVQTVTATLKDLVSGTELARVDLVTPAASGAFSDSISVDLQGVTLPATHGVQLALSATGSLGTTPTTLASVEALTYNVVT